VSNVKYGTKRSESEHPKPEEGFKGCKPSNANGEINKPQGGLLMNEQVKWNHYIFKEFYKLL
jgi:hypothetical protein